jgi:hypothetical protein
MLLAEQTQPRKRGVRDVIIGVVSAAMIMSPSYLADILMSRAKVAISIAAVVALAVFLVGVFLMIRLLKD